MLLDVSYFVVIFTRYVSDINLFLFHTPICFGLFHCPNLIILSILLSMKQAFDHVYSTKNFPYYCKFENKLRIEVIFVHRVELNIANQLKS